jgi:branched-chain amino acid transport system ATP-binding protein
MLTINNIEVMYSEVILVLKGVSLELREHQIVVLLGANGSGKTTTLKAISGLLRTETGKVTSGTIEFEGSRIDDKDPEDIVQKGIVQVFEGRRLFEHLTVEENLKVGTKSSLSRGALKMDLERIFKYFPRLKSLRQRTSGYLSGGEQQMVVIGGAMMIHPKVLLLDEPSLGLSPLLVTEIFHIIKQINDQEKTSIILVEQNANISLGVADYGYILENGKVVLDGTAEKMKGNEDIKEFYLGLNELGERKRYRDVKHYRRRKRWLA